MKVFSDKVSIKIVPDVVREGRTDNKVPVDFLHNKRKIGSAFSGSSVLRGLTFAEERLLLPSIVGDSPTNATWSKATKDYWSNISVPVPHGSGLELEVGFMYETEEQAKEGNKEKLDQLALFNVAKKKGEFFKEDFTKRHENGTPISVTDYILYRYCLVYNKVANDPDKMHASKKIVFYIHSDVKKKAAKVVNHKLVMQAQAAYMKIVNDANAVRNVLNVMHFEIIQHNAATKDPVDHIVTGSKETNEIGLYALANTFPTRFVEVANDATLKIKAFIERAITAGELRRLPNTDTIVYGDNTQIGNNLNEAVVFITDAKNNEIVQTIKARLENLQK